MEQDNAWLVNRLAFIKGLKKSTETQQLLVLLAEQSTRTPEEERKLKALIKTERANDKAQAAKAALNQLLQTEKQAQRKQRDHELYQVTGLLIKAGLVDSQTGKPVMDKGELLGALVGLANVPLDHVKRVEWKQTGDKLLKG
ncbi:conjugal transfer protein TraD [Thiofilum flexile]|uniref:conjugal transfer protein TraD n=1 Tax=Thiofilum flexile TaxID=125627 RepID=UPI00037A0EF0|nr:conjugal transfer protein TraD [Thiofilum flexile]